MLLAKYNLQHGFSLQRVGNISSQIVVYVSQQTIVHCHSKYIRKPNSQNYIFPPLDKRVKIDEYLNKVTPSLTVWDSLL